MDKKQPKENQISRDLIVEVITAIHGCRLTELSVKLSKHLTEKNRQYVFDGNFDLYDLIERMIKDGELVSINYVTPDSRSVKTFLLPGGTQFI